jgi:cystathionine gamma-lyase
VFDLEAINAALEADPAIRVIHIQRSCGYQWRPSLPVARIGEVITKLRERWGNRRELIVFVDNCYGEFVEDVEPTHVGADLVAGSLIKVWQAVCGLHPTHSLPWRPAYSYPPRTLACMWS